LLRLKVGDDSIWFRAERIGTVETCCLIRLVSVTIQPCASNADSYVTNLSRLDNRRNHVHLGPAKWYCTRNSRSHHACTQSVLFHNYTSIFGYRHYHCTLHKYTGACFWDSARYDRRDHASAKYCFRDDYRSIFWHWLYYSTDH
jgi:hypothetical protein